MKRLFAVFLLLLMLFSAPFLLNKAKFGKASGTITITANGDVLGSSQIQREGNLYILKENIEGSIIVERNNIVVDGARYSLKGDGSAKGIDLSLRNNVTVRNMEITGFYDKSGEKLAILMDRSTNSLIINNNISRNGEGISMRGAQNITILGNRITDYTDHGIIILESENVTVKGNTLLPDPSVRTTYGLTLYQSKYCRVHRNNITKSYPYGAQLISSSENVISENYIANNYVGIYVNFGGENLIIGNMITENDRWGMQLSSQENSPSNIIYHNNFVNNNKNNISEELQVSNPWFFGPESNTWDNGKEGNYWSDYKMRYPGAKEVDGLGVWNTAFFINPNNIDHYPLVNPWIPDITPPSVLIISPENKTYTTTDVQLTFLVNEDVIWMGYSLDGQEIVTITGNTTLTGLANGLHNITVYARDEFENTGASETITFSVEVPFPTILVVTVSGVVVSIVCIGFLIYFKKRRK